MSYYIGDFSSSDGEEEMQANDQNRTRDTSPPLLLAFSQTCGSHLKDFSPEPGADLHEEDKDEDDPIEDWMILSEVKEEEGDSSIQLNLSYWNSSEVESEDKDEDEMDEIKQSMDDAWAVSARDKNGADFSRSGCSFSRGRSLTCQLRSKTRYISNNCFHQKKSLICGLCGTRGHIQRSCPGLHCLTCGRPPHGPSTCEVPAIWKQQCQRCRMMGHLSDVCPDTWRQYHLTITSGAPVKPQSIHNQKIKRNRAHCYNCGFCGHYGSECTQKRMISGTFPSLPFICHYDSKEELLQHLNGAKEHAGFLRPPEFAQLSANMSECCEKQESVQAKNKTKQKACSRALRKKTWPERRRERRQVKLLRREAQAMREGGILGKPCNTNDAEVCPTNPFGKPVSRQSSPVPKRRRRDEKGCRKISGKLKTMKRGGLKCRELYPYGDIDIRSEDNRFTKQRVRHRKK